MFGILENLTKAVVGVVTLPVNLVADVVTMGGVLTDKEETYTGKNLESILDNLEKAIEDK